MSNLNPPIFPVTGALCSTAKNITIREEHAGSESSDIGLVAWTYEGGIPAKGNAQEAWKTAKEKKELFKIESHNFGPVDCG